jgi:uncharacterized protein (UPF0264 family)
MEPAALAAFVSSVREAGLFVALAGRLTAGDLPFVRDAGRYRRSVGRRAMAAAAGR